MPDMKRTAHGRSRLPEPQPAAFAALSVTESLILALVESGCLEPQVLRRCLLDALAAHDEAGARASGDADAHQAIHAETVRLIDRLLQQIEAVAPRPAGTAVLSAAPVTARLLNGEDAG